MSINPITVERLKTFVLIGHSNADGWASTDLMWDTATYLAPGSVDDVSTSAFFWKNVYVATSAQPFPASNHDPVASLISDVNWLELTVSNPVTPAGLHPHDSPYNYPNNQGACYPRWMYDAANILPSGGGTGTRCGVEIPFSWFWHHHWNEQVGVVKVAFSSTYMMRADIAGAAASTIASTWLDAYGWGADTPNNGYPSAVNTSPDGFYAYWTPADKFDWAPGTDRLFKMLLDKMGGAQSALAPNTKMDVRLLVVWMGDNESLGRDASALENGAFYNACKTLRDKLRQACVDNDWTTLPAHQIPVVWPKVHPGYPPNVDFCNAELERLAKDDPYMRLVETSDLGTIADDGYTTIVPSSANHYGVTGYLSAAERIYDAFQEIEVEPFDAIAEEDRVSVSEVKDRVRTYYNRARVQTDVDDDLVLIHLNGALNSILGHIGDNAYWLRRRELMSLTTSITDPVEFPKYVSRVLKIERPSNTNYPIHFEQIGFSNGGKIQVLIPETPGGDLYVTYIYRPRDLTRDDELVPLPRQYVEWLVVDTCRRLARAGSNVALQASLEGEAQTLQARCMHDMGVMQRGKKDRLRTQRRNVTLGYRRGIYYPWGNDISR